MSKLSERPDIEAYGFKKITGLFEHTNPEIEVWPFMICLKMVDSQIEPSNEKSKAWFDGQKEGKILRLHPMNNDKIRSVAQNRLLHMWLSEAGKHHGLGMDKMKRGVIKKFVHPILMRDNARYAEMWVAVRECEPKNRKILRDRIIDLIHTSDLDPKQYWEMLQEFERDQRSKGVDLTVTGENYELARVK